MLDGTLRCVAASRSACSRADAEDRDDDESAPEECDADARAARRGERDAEDRPAGRAPDGGPSEGVTVDVGDKEARALGRELLASRAVPGRTPWSGWSRLV